MSDHAKHATDGGPCPVCRHSHCLLVTPTVSEDLARVLADHPYALSQIYVPMEVQDRQHPVVQPATSTPASIFASPNVPTTSTSTTSAPIASTAIPAAGPIASTSRITQTLMVVPVPRIVEDNNTTASPSTSKVILGRPTNVSKTPSGRGPGRPRKEPTAGPSTSTDDASDAPKRSFCCKFCSTEFNNRQSFYKHTILTHSTELALKRKHDEKVKQEQLLYVDCPYCKNKYRNFKSLKNHLIGHDKTVCNKDRTKVWPDNKLAEEYVQQIEKKWEFDYSAKGDKNKAVTTSKKSSDLPCPYCAETFDTIHKKHYHVLTRHPALFAAQKEHDKLVAQDRLRAQTCPSCQMQFKNWDVLCIHLTRQPKQCQALRPKDYDAKKTIQEYSKRWVFDPQNPDAFQESIRNKNNVSVKCPYCEDVFTSRQMSKLHMKYKHADVGKLQQEHKERVSLDKTKMHQCPLCMAVLANWEQLGLHLRRRNKRCGLRRGPNFSSKEELRNYAKLRWSFDYKKPHAFQVPSDEERYKEYKRKYDDFRHAGAVPQLKHFPFTTSAAASTLENLRKKVSATSPTSSNASTTRTSPSSDDGNTANRKKRKHSSEDPSCTSSLWSGLSDITGVPSPKQQRVGSPRDDESGYFDASGVSEESGLADESREEERYDNDGHDDDGDEADDEPLMDTDSENFENLDTFLGLDDTFGYIDMDLTSSGLDADDESLPPSLSPADIEPRGFVFHDPMFFDTEETKETETSDPNTEVLLAALDNISEETLNSFLPETSEEDPDIDDLDHLIPIIDHLEASCNIRLSDAAASSPRDDQKLSDDDGGLAESVESDEFIKLADPQELLKGLDDMDESLFDNMPNQTPHHTMDSQDYDQLTDSGKNEDLGKDKDMDEDEMGNNEGLSEDKNMFKTPVLPPSKASASSTHGKSKGRKAKESDSTSEKSLHCPYCRRRLKNKDTLNIHIEKPCAKSLLAALRGIDPSDPKLQVQSVQCVKCGKWRAVYLEHPNQYDDVDWTCPQNPERKYSKCSAPESERVSDGYPPEASESDADDITESTSTSSASSSKSGTSGKSHKKVSKKGSKKR